MAKKSLHDGVLHQSKLPFLLLLAPLALVLTILLHFACLAYPLPVGDATNFIPPVLSLSQGDGFINHLWPILDNPIDRTQQSRFVGHGFLYQQYLLLFSGWDLPGLYFGQALIACFTLLVALLVFLQATVRQLDELHWRDLILLSLSVFGMGTHLLFFGRPDILAEFFVAIGILACMKLPYQALRFLLPVLVALLAVTTVTAPFLALPLLGLYLSQQFTTARCIKELLLLIVLPSLIALALAELLFSYSVAEWISGIVMHCKLAILAILRDQQETGRFLDLTSIRYFWILDPTKTAYGLIVFYAILQAGINWFQRRREIASPWLFLLSSIALLAVLFFLTLLTARTSYRFIPFMPLAYLVLVQQSRRAKTALNFDWLVPAILCLLSTLGFARMLALYPYFLHQGMSYVEAKEKFVALQPLLGKKVGVTGSLWVLGDDPSRFQLARVYSSNKIANISPRTPLLVQQQHLGRNKAPELLHYTMHENHFVPGSPTFLGIRLGTSIPGYQFACYLPKENADAAR